MIDIWIHIVGFPRVEGDEDEDDVDDLEKEFDYAKDEASGSLRYAGATSTHGGLAATSSHDSPNGLNFPLLTYGEEVRLINHLVVC